MAYYFKCPLCRNDEHFKKPSEESSLGCALFVFGGLLPALVYADSMARRVQCGKCAHIFRPPPLPVSPLSKMATWFGLIIAVFLLAAVLLTVFSDTTALIPTHPLLEETERLVSEHPRVVALTLVPLPVLLLIVALITSFLSNLRFRRQFRQEYETRPSDFSLLDRIHRKEDEE